MRNRPSLSQPSDGFFMLTGSEWRAVLLISQAQQEPAYSLSPAAGFEARPQEPAGKSEWPTADRSVFEGLGG